MGGVKAVKAVAYSALRIGAKASGKVSTQTTKQCTVDKCVWLLLAMKNDTDAVKKGEGCLMK